MAIALRKCLPLQICSVFRNSPVLAYSLAKWSKPQFSNWKSQAQEIVPDYRKIENELSQEVFAKVNDQITNKTHGRLFAVVHVKDIQYKVTTEDIIIVEKFWAPTLGDKIRLEKVLLVGCSDFTLIGRPLLPLDQVSVIGTVIEKTLSHTIPQVTYRPRKNDLRHHFWKNELTLVRINSINITGKVNELGSIEGLKDRIF